jgi:hypothetical protein
MRFRDCSVLATLILSLSRGPADDDSSAFLTECHLSIDPQWP